ncbi:MAG: hypothetical protein AAGJ95_07885 [Cyanobacteria bacterium J06554_11]
MVNRYSLGAAILSIFLLAIFGIRGAFSWLSQSPQRTQSDQVAVNGDGATDSEFVDRLPAPGTQADGRSDQPAGLSSDALTLSPLEEAGTYIQRQKRVERDPIVADTRVDVVPAATSAANNAATQAQPNTQIDQSGAATSPNQSASGTPATAAPASQAVPALW